MLFLHSIKTFNFKSYKDLHLIGPFDRKFTAIVGPNGCGKSNVIDAILFVLGYNAKKMRHSALKDLVYKGESEMYVEIKFEIQNEETQNISNKHEALFLKRSFSFLNEKNSSSKYFIDNKNITHSEYLNILKRHNLNTNRFLILQGEIESISLMDSLQLLEYLESCIGTLELKELIETQTEKLKMLEKEFFIKEDDFTLEENTFKNMLRKFMSFHKSMEEKKNEINKKIKVLNKEQSNANSKLTKENDRLVQLKEEQNQIVAEKENLSKNVKKPHKPTELTETEDLFLKLQKEKEDIEIDYEVVNRKCEKLQLRTREEKDKYLHLEEKSKEDLVDLCNEKQDKINALYRKIEVFKEKNKEVYQEIEKYEKIIFDLNKKDEKYKNYVETKSILEKYKIEINALYKANNLKKEGLEEEFLSLQNKKKILEKNIFELRQKINEFSFYKKEEETALNNNKKDFKDNFMHMDGFVDVFYNMLEIEEGYEKAVCASTSHLCSIIVETTKDAEEMIKIINQKNLPRTTFVILDKIVAKNGSGINYNNCKKVIDCVKIKGEYKKYSKILSLFDYNTFITENLTEGRQLAYNSGTRKRVVTKQGVLL